MSKIKIGITVGDINGIGLEVILKTLSDERILNYCVPVIYGSSKVVSYHKNIIDEHNSFQFNNIKSASKIREHKINIINCWEDNVNISLGTLNEAGGKYAYIALEQSMIDLNNGSIDAIVTAPINKKAMQLANFPFPGHTEYLTDRLEGKESLMLMVNDTLRVGLVCNHVALKDIPKEITKNRIITKLKIFEEALKMDFNVAKPKIAVLALNPHAGDEGVIGSEEEDIIKPAILEMKKKGMLVLGPYAADGFFGSSQYRAFDGILAMYHDQGLIPFKALSFGSGVNFTAGLKGIRTSPDHGTAYDIAGKGVADPSSFRQALFLAKDIAQNRNSFLEIKKNAMTRKERPSEDVLATENELDNIAEE